MAKKGVLYNRPSWLCKHEKNPDRYKPITCNCCYECWFDLETNQCVFGGPFIGYIEIDTGRTIVVDRANDERIKP
jgi:hypothetical protein